jgi:hypothetical protein
MQREAECHRIITGRASHEVIITAWRYQNHRKNVSCHQRLTLINTNHRGPGQHLNQVTSKQAHISKGSSSRLEGIRIIARTSLVINVSLPSTLTTVDRDILEPRRIQPGAHPKRVIVTAWRYQNHRENVSCHQRLTPVNTNHRGPGRTWTRSNGRKWHRASHRTKSEELQTFAFPSFRKANHIPRNTRHHHSRQTIASVLSAMDINEHVGTRRHRASRPPALLLRIPWKVAAGPGGTLPPHSTLCGIRQAPPSGVKRPSPTIQMLEDHLKSCARIP